MTKAALAVYKALLKSGSAFPDYNIRAYVLRRTRAVFREKRNLTGAAAEAAIIDAKKQLEIVERQGVIARMYKSEDSVVEYESTRTGRGVLTR
jgi:LYR motif-containing protein 4